ncbi:MAG: hypothetical protein A2293_02525 [Elusimicrobia bacterium RIFOXYB2_FULL_49_7]|nr:MAG: hypothetical protein A2293_02525 [Elusimicrobia bacterium RIFOXYB2_FULL_49_7]
MTLIRYILVLSAICCLSGGLLSYVDQLTRGPIAEAAKREQKNAICEVFLSRFPDVRIAEDPEKDRDYREITIPDAETGQEKKMAFFCGRDQQDSLIGFAVKTASFKGYSGRIDFMFGIALDGTVCGTRVLEHRETPGLGSKLKDESYWKQYLGLSRATGDIRIKKFGGTIESISGASISSHAMTSALNEALVQFDKIILQKGSGQ